MGRAAMTLLSTLAALVIIVHTAEEEYERSQRGLRARSMDVGSPGYEQTWRAMEVEPMLPNIPQGDTWRDAEAEPKRRRMRKRKRRPQIDEPDLLTQERQISSNTQSRNTEFAVDPPDTKRHRKHNRKNTRNNQKDWEDESDVERPVRRRGHRRKRPPTIDSWPRLSEFDHLRPSEAIAEENVWNKETEPIHNENIWNKDSEPIDNEDDTNIEQENKEDMEENHDDTQDVPIEVVSETNAPESNAPVLQNDKSLSEFSLESLIKSSEDGLSFTEVKNKKPQSERNKALIKIAQNNEPLAPLTLKAILKRSNGRSLSEILQQNNLSLSDLLQGRVNALSLLKSREENSENTNQVGDFEGIPKNKDDSDSTFAHSESNQINEYKKTNDPEPTTTTTEVIYTTEYKSTIENQSVSSLNDTAEDITTTPKTFVRRRFPFNLRRRTRPVNGTYKGQLSRDLMALTTRKYQKNRNIHRSREWVEYMPSNTKSRKLKPKIENKQNSETESSISMTTVLVEETTQPTQDLEDTVPTSPNDWEISDSNSFTQHKVTDAPESEVFSTTFNSDDILTTVPVTEKVVTITQKPQIIPHIRSMLNASELRRQALNNRLEKKRLREKNLSTESHGLLQKDVLNANNMQTSSEFIAKTQPSTSNTDIETDFTTLEDFLPTEAAIRHHSRMRTTKSPNVRSSLLPKIQPYITATEETAKFEIEEILNDSMTRARLSRILKERNMTLNELVEHRERGSSHVHLADIFHNASKEPNPPEPFLSKSLIEPISKETYPLIALLEANLHDPKMNLEEIGEPSNYMNIPVVMDFGNNVNENGENMGIMSLFNKNNGSVNDSDGNEKQEKNIDITPATDTKDEQKQIREGRTMGSEKGLVNWNELFKLLHNQSQEQEVLQPRISTKSETLQKILPDDDEEGDDIIAFAELDKLKGNYVDTSKEDFELRLLNKIEETHARPIYNSISNTRSVTVVTASIIGLALVLFLLTYAAFKWKQQSKIIENKQCNNDDRLPSPIFENRKGIRSSTRSKSPMLTSNIYSVNTLDTHAGTESPEYMWDSLRKPFQ
ncbi:uncharacterized protein LOC123715376 [Pieris brassicae]|uniref:uncharacterized protein LOC123715376 n=1 Tax=Pieris brassicae TaxID=7116 RepID=UPI001E65E41B|nr:uncharacterized protein LOC123715376 [Pieris brassicae]